jgi:hypothetical protein
MSRSGGRDVHQHLDHLFVGTTDTGSFATDTLTVNTAPPPPACVGGIAVAQWTFATGFTVSAPAPSSGSGTASPGAGVTAFAFSSGSDSWGSNGNIATGATLVTANNDYLEFVIATSGFESVDLTFDARRGNSANSPTGVAVYYGPAAGNPETGALLYSNANVLTTTLTNVGGTLTLTPSTSPTYVRIYFFNSAIPTPVRMAWWTMSPSPAVGPPILRLSPRPSRPTRWRSAPPRR